MIQEYTSNKDSFDFNPNLITANYFGYDNAKIQKDGNILLNNLEMSKPVYVGDEDYFLESEEKIFVEFVKFLHARNYINLLDYNSI